MRAESQAFRMRNFQFSDYMLKGIPVLRPKNGFRRGSDHLDAAFLQRCRQIDCCLTTKGGNHASRLFQVNDIQDILHGKWLKIQFVRSSIIG